MANAPKNKVLGALNDALAVDCANGCITVK